MYIHRGYAVSFFFYILGENENTSQLVLGRFRLSSFSFPASIVMITVISRARPAGSLGPHQSKVSASTAL